MIHRIFTRGNRHTRTHNMGVTEKYGSGIYQNTTIKNYRGTISSQNGCGHHYYFFVTEVCLTRTNIKVHEM